jgi:ABC-type polysaccharide/polyol phosphate export permease
LTGLRNLFVDLVKIAATVSRLYPSSMKRIFAIGEIKSYNEHLMSVLTIFSNRQYRQLLFELTKREIAQRYKQSILGYLWVISNPLIQMLVMSFVFSRLFQVAGYTVPYPLFLFAGLLPWTLFSSSLISGTNSLVTNAGLLSKIYFPRELLVTSVILAKIIDFFLSSLIFIILILFFRVPMTLSVAWVLPIFLIQNIFTYALSLFLSTMNLFYRDIQYVLNLVLFVWLYMTPVMYSIETFPPKDRWLLELNPMSILINSYRVAIFEGKSPQLMNLAIVSVLSILLLLIGFSFFKKMEGYFADVV